MGNFISWLTTAVSSFIYIGIVILLYSVCSLSTSLMEDFVVKGLILLIITLTYVMLLAICRGLKDIM